MSKLNEIDFLKPNCYLFHGSVLKVGIRACYLRRAPQGTKTSAGFRSLLGDLKAVQSENDK